MVCHECARVRLFRTGVPREDSDLDLPIEAGRQTPPWFPGGLLFDLEDELGRSVDVAEAQTLHPLYRGACASRGDSGRIGSKIETMAIVEIPETLPTPTEDPVYPAAVERVKAAVRELQDKGIIDGQA
jgi:hypothetical protein